MMKDPSIFFHGFEALRLSVWLELATSECLLCPSLPLVLSQAENENGPKQYGKLLNYQYLTENI